MTLFTGKEQYLVDGTNKSISPIDRGFSYGDGVFRTFKIKHGKPIDWDLHYQKLEADCNVLRIVCPSPDILLADIHKLFADEAGYFVAKIIITRGESKRGYALPTLAQPTRVLVKSEFPNYPESHYTDGVKLHLCELRLSEQPLMAGIKHLNRLENVLARMEWSDSAIADGVILDKAGRVIECTASNIFIRVNQTLMTPKLNRCGVAGVTRDYLLANAKKLGLKAKQVSLSLVDLMNADEVLICNSIFGVWQVVDFNNKLWEKQSLAQQCRELLAR